jgi:protein Mpv17
MLTQAAFIQPFVSTVGIAWTAYLSLTNAAGDVAENRIANRADIRLP